ncbi:helix-turn-helix domain-containing protein [Chryseobacterium rhizoplanae]|uniref:helix-turn-helix domain-containing protein n=1 Tax=Chryseobacterium rhizoplanae TaxID=1609531 RepID=UPI001CE2E4CA|nr:helix-turn-helix domain-containing protein [Chryseobacterium rhizoplanae]UCA61745.1 helix-turn-helix domain-containing protein [Chryseobacterium rhizoplanae]
MLLIQGQKRIEKYQEDSFKKISGLIETYSENDDRAMVFVRMYIEKAKKECDYKELIQGYEEAIYYSKSIDQKLIYADSTIIAAKKYNNQDQISRAYLGKGIIYYYNKRQYKSALDEYLLAFQFSKDSKDNYLKNKIVYHLGMVKSYLGYYEEAVELFEVSARYFEKNMVKNLHPNLKLNNESGYFNSIYRLSSCYKNLQLFHKEDSLINIGLERLHDTKQHPLEYSLFQKGKGIQLLRENKLDEALKHLDLSQKILNHNQDYASLITVYFYIGKLYWLKEERGESLLYLNKVDSLVNQFRVVTPEIRRGYEYLIHDAKQSRDSKKQLYYTNQLLKADSIINTDFAMLSSKIHREYDTDALLKEKNSLERKQNIGLIVFCLSIIAASIILYFLIVRFRKREQELNATYQELSEKFNNPRTKTLFNRSSQVSLPEKNGYSLEVIEEVRLKLKVFEDNKQFLQKNLTIQIVAKMIGTNRTHLSYLLNEHYHLTFTMYLKTLRITYITNLLLEDTKYLNYSIDGLAQICGIVNRQLFSKHFMEINSMRPIDFIRKRKEELENF